MYFEKSWTGLADGTSIGPGWVVTAGSSSGFQVKGGQLAPLDTGTTLARYTTPVSTPGEAWVEWRVGSAASADEVYVGLVTETTSTTDLATDGLYVRVTGGLIRLYRKTANSSSLTAIGVSAGNISYAPAAGDLVRITVHGGDLSYSINGVTRYTFTYTAVTLANYIYPALRMRQASPTTARVDRFRAADYGVESGGSVPLLQGATVRTKEGAALKYLGIWTGTAITPQPLKFTGSWTPPTPIARLATQGPDPAMQNPPALPGSFTPLRTVSVTDNASLAAAMLDARPGDLINLAAGTYTDQKLILKDKAGTAQNPIVVRGPKEAIVNLGTSASDYGSGYVGQVDNCSYVWLFGFTIQHGPKGLVTDQMTDSWLKGLTVRDVEQEAVHLRNFSKRNVVEDCTIGESGKKSKGFGEGLYNGTAKSNLTASTSRTGGAPDNCDDNVFRRNHVYQATAECLDIKEGSSRVLVEYNWWDGSYLGDYNSAVSWVSCKANDCVIQHNFGDFTYESAYIVYNPTAGVDGLRNTFRGNTGNVRAADGTPLPGPAIEDKVGSGSGTIVYDDNVFRYVGSLYNQAVTSTRTALYSDTFTGTNGAAPAAAWTRSGTDVTIQGNAMVLNPGASAWQNKTYAMLGVPDDPSGANGATLPGAVADFDLTFDYTLANLNQQYPRIGLRSRPRTYQGAPDNQWNGGAGDGGFKLGYELALQVSEGYVSVVACGSTTELAKTAVPFPTIGRLMRWRILVQGTRLAYKVWTLGQTEPGGAGSDSNWTYDSASVLTDRSDGWFAFSASSGPSGGQTVTIDNLASTTRILSRGVSRAAPVYDPAGFTRAVTENFDTAAAAGAGAGQFLSVYAGTFTPYGEISPQYQQQAMLSAHDGVMDITMDGARGSAGFFGSGAAAHRTGGRFAMRAKALGAYNNGPAIMVWPSSDVWSDGELDFPESVSASGGSQGFQDAPYIHHHSMTPGNEATAQDIPLGVSWRDWHVYAVEWYPPGKGPQPSTGLVIYYVDDVEVYRTTQDVPTTNHRYTFQVGSWGRPGHLYIDWVTISDLK